MQMAIYSFYSTNMYLVPNMWPVVCVGKVIIISYLILVEYLLYARHWNRFFISIVSFNFPQILIGLLTQF